MILHRLLADAVVIVHAAYASIVVGGLVAVVVGWRCRWRWVRNFWFRSIHLLMILVVAVQGVLGAECPLTTLEKHLRERAGQATYPGSFIGHWVHELLFFDFRPGVFTIAYCLFGGLVLATFLLVPPRWPRAVSPE